MTRTPTPLPKYVELPLIEAHAAFLRDNGWNAKVWKAGDKARIYINGLKKGITAFLDYDHANGPFEAYDGSVSISHGSALRVFGKRRTQSTWWLENLGHQIHEAYEESGQA